MKLKRVLLIFLVGSCCRMSEAVAGSDAMVRREFGFELLTLQQAPATISALFQSSDGFIWFGTDNGLMRFDGNGLRKFALHDKGGDRGNSVIDITEDKDRNLWFSTHGGGLFRLSLVSEQLEVLRHGEALDTLSSDTLMEVAYSRIENALWVGSRNWLNRVELDSGKVERVDGTGFDAKAFNHNAWSLLVDNRGLVWSGTLGSGVVSIDSKTNTIHTYDKNTGLSDDNVRSIVQDLQGNIWVATDHGLNRIDPESGVIERFLAAEEPGKLNNDELNKLFVDSSGVVWVGTWGAGLSAYDPASGHFTNYDFSSLGLRVDRTPKNVYDIIEDSGGTLWFATEKGVVKLPRRARKIEHYARSKGEGRVGAIMSNRSGLWFSVGTTLIGFDGFKQASLGNNITALADAGDGGVWAGTEGGGLFRFSGEADLTGAYLNAKQVGLHITAVHIVDDTRLLLGLRPADGMSGGVMLFDTQKGILAQALEDKHIVDIEEEGFGEFVLGSEKSGLFHLDLEDFDTEEMVIANMPDVKHIRDLLLDGKGSAYLSTDWQGLIKVDLLSLVGEKAASEVETSNWLVSDGKDKVWFASEQGILALERGMLSPSLGLGDILPVSDYVPRAAAIYGDTLAIGAPSGLYLLRGVANLAHWNPPPLQLTGLEILNRRVMPSIEGDSPIDKALPFSSGVHLSHNDYLFALSFAALDYDAPNSYDYQYRLSGFDKHWLEASSFQRRAVYSNVPPGDYRFEVRARHLTSGRVQAEQGIDVSVLPPWWQTPLGYVLYLTLAVGSLLLLISLRTRTLTRRAERLERAVKHRTMELERRNREISELIKRKDFIFTAVSHEFRTPLSMILNPLADMLQQTQDEHEKQRISIIRRNADRLSNLVEQVLHLAFVKDHHSKEVCRYRLPEVLMAVVRHYEPLSADKSLTVELQDIAAVGLQLHKESPQMILGNLLSNAIKYSSYGSRIEITSKHEGEFVAIAICDGGLGIEPELQHQVFEPFNRGRFQDNLLVKGVGLGLTIVQELVVLEGGELTLSSEPGRGSTFTVRLPCHPLDDAYGAYEFDAPLYDMPVSGTEPPAESREQESSQEALPVALFIEDNPELLAYFPQYFAGKFDCRLAQDGRQGLQLATEIVPDIIVSDVMMPHVDGYELCRRVKNDELLCHIPLILLTAKSDLESRIEGWQGYADDYMGKPFDNRELEARMFNLLAIRQILVSRFEMAFKQDDTSGESANVNSGLSAMDRAFVVKVDDCIERNYADSAFQLPVLANGIALSDRQLQRKLRAVVGMTFSEYLRSYRLRRSRDLLREGLPIGVVADSVGFSSQSYYAACFKTAYGETPSQYQEGKVDSV